MQTQDFEQFALDSRARWGRVPLSGALEVTWRCNLQCVHCYACDYRPDERELSTDEITDIVNQLAEAGCLRLLVTGGEPLLRPDFRTIWRHAFEKGIRLTLFTNATLATDEIAQFLKDYPPAFCEVTLYGASAETYGRVTGRPEAFDLAVAGIRRLRGALPYVGAKTMLLRENVDEHEAMARLCDELGVVYNFDTDVFPRLDRDPAPMEHAVDTEMGVDIVMRSLLHRTTWNNQESQDDQAPEGPPRRADKIVVCRAGEWTFHIGPYGDLCLCAMLRQPSVSLRDTPLRDAWESAVPHWLEIERTHPSPCIECPDLRYCVPCAGRNFLETGDPETAAPRMCERVAAIARALEREKREHSGEHAAKG